MSIFNDKKTKNEPNGTIRLKFKELEEDWYEELKPIETYKDVFSFLRKKKIYDQEVIGFIFGVTSTSIRNWMKNENEKIPIHMIYCLNGFMLWNKSILKDKVTEFSFVNYEWFLKWSDDLGFMTLEDKGMIFNYNRQNIHKWKTNGIPKWTFLASIGFEDLLIKNKVSF